MIPCKLLATIKNKYMENDSLERRFGHYLNSFYPIKGFGRDCWVVVVNILVDYEQYLKEGLNEEKITLECIKYLNHRPKSKYGKRRRRKATYGIFRNIPYSFKPKEKDGKKIIQTLLVVEERKNKNFWGEGRKDI